MAARVSITIRRNAALEQIENAMRQLYGEGFILPRQGHDAELVYAQQLEYIAGFLAAKTGRAPTGLEAMRALEVEMTEYKGIELSKPMVEALEEVEEWANAHTGPVTPAQQKPTHKRRKKAS